MHAPGLGSHINTSRAAARRLGQTLSCSVGVFALTTLCFAQSHPTPGAPSIPLTQAALANGVQDRITYQYGTEFVTIGATGNAAWTGNGTVGDRAVGRGSVNYEYRLGRFEVNTSQWVAFYNAAFDRASDDRLPWLTPPTFWGAAPAAPTHPEGQRWSVPAGNEMRAVGNISWRTAAMYANWLHNDQSTDRAAFMNGAYDVSTFGQAPGGGFSDQATHNPAARFWIPTWDEWLKGAHMDPSRSVGDAQGQWWLRPNAGDAMLAYGPPGQHVNPDFPIGPNLNGPLAQANGGWDDLDFPGFDAFGVVLGAYTHVQSPWGLMDLAGGTTEWTEEIGRSLGRPVARLFDGSPWFSSGDTTLRDYLPQNFTGETPNLAPFSQGFRVAAAVPAPHALAIFGMLLIVGFPRRSRVGEDQCVSPYSRS